MKASKLSPGQPCWAQSPQTAQLYVDFDAPDIFSFFPWVGIVTSCMCLCEYPEKRAWRRCSGASLPLFWVSCLMLVSASSRTRHWRKCTQVRLWLPLPRFINLPTTKTKKYLKTKCVFEPSSPIQSTVGACSHTRTNVWCLEPAPVSSASRRPTLWTWYGAECRLLEWRVTRTAPSWAPWGRLSQRKGWSADSIKVLVWTGSKVPSR